MKAISLKQPWAGYVASGSKPIETRTWRTQYRGELLICASLKPDKRVSVMYYDSDLCSIYGMALCLVDLVDCVPFRPEHVEKARCGWYEGFAWKLENIRIVNPYPIKGQLSIYNLPESIAKQIIVSS